MLELEKTQKTDQLDTLVKFGKDTYQKRNLLVKLVTNLKSQGKRIIGYGASGRATVHINFCKFNSEIVEYVIDASHERQGRFIPGMHIPIVSPDKLKNDKRWVYGLPSYSKAGGNFAFMQHMIYHLDEKNGRLGLVLANGAMSGGGDEGKIRQKIVENDLINCIIALPKRLFFTTGIPVSLWFFTKNKDDGKSRKRKGETLFIDARKIFTQKDRAHNKLSEEQVIAIRNEISENYNVEGELRGEVTRNIKRLMDIGTYRGFRHRKGLPVRGQNTKNNSRTRKGKKKTVAGKKKAAV